MPQFDQLSSMPVRIVKFIRNAAGEQTPQRVSPAQWGDDCVLNTPLHAGSEEQVIDFASRMLDVQADQLEVRRDTRYSQYVIRQSRYETVTL